MTVPFHLGSVPHAMETLLAKWGGALRPGDVFVMNDPFDGGIHLQDIFVFKPIFLDGHLIGFATTTAHHGDVGGRLPGSAACDNTEIFQEGIRLPWLRLYDRGEPVEAIFEVIRANVRIPRMTLGDLAAQVAATSVAERALCELGRRLRPRPARRADERPDRPQRAARATGDRGLARRHRHLHRLPRLGRDRAARRADHGHRDDRRRRDHRRLHRVLADGPGRAEQHALVHPGVRLPGGPLGRQRRGPEHVGRLPADPRADEAGHDRTRRDAGRVVDARCHRLPRARRGQRRARAARSRPGSAPPARAATRSRCSAPTARTARGGSSSTSSSSARGAGRPPATATTALTNPASLAANIPVEVAESEFPITIERYGLVPDSGGAGDAIAAGSRSSASGAARRPRRR